MRSARLTVLWTIGAALATAAPIRPAAPATPLKLAVVLVVDQMRADYVDRFRREWTGGLKRMLDGGMWFRRAAYPYLETVTCAGHASISTGAFPHAHGVIQNVWWDRDSKAPITCTADADANGISYGALAVSGESAHRLMLPTLGDTIRTEREGHVVTVSLKARSAIMLAGHGADASLWLDEAGDGWESSSVFGDGESPALKALLEKNPIAADYGKTWTRAEPPDRYHEPDEGEAEDPPAGWTASFPHVLTSPSGRPDAAFHMLWERSPFADDYLGRIAAALVDHFQLGKHQGTDLLGVSFSSTDLVGHAFGPDSQEVHDMYAPTRPHGRIAARSSRLGGRPRQLRRCSQRGSRRDGHPGAGDPRAEGRWPSERKYDRAGDRRSGAAGRAGQIRGARRIQRHLLRAGHVHEACWISRGDERGRRRAPTDAWRRGGIPFGGVRGAANSTNRMLRAAALSYFPGRSGDLILIPKPGWMFAPSGTTHGTVSPDDQRVPLIFYGAGIRHGISVEPVTPGDLAPTLAAVIGVQLAGAEGHPLASAIVAGTRSTDQR